MSDMANTDPEWIDGVRMTWNVWPRTKVEANKCVIGAPQSLPSPVYVFVLDTCMIEEEVGFVKSALKRAVELVPDNALVGFVSFGNQVQVHELGSSDLSKVYVFRGSKEISKEQVLEQLGLGVLGRRPSPKGVQNGCPNASVTRFLLPASDCEYTLNTLLDKLQTDQWSVAPGNPASRCTGVALSVAAGLLGACVPGTGARIVALVGGPCTEGPGAIVWKDLSEPVRSHKDLAAAGAEYDSVSNNGSWSGESEDHKDKTSNPPARQEALPKADNDKREKIRQKNERKHQRQKERRAQELHERCSSYLMSRKLEALAQQLVAMGFSQERATMALILNEGRVEESVAWLFEGGEDADQLRDQNNFGGGNLKIDISEELARISDMETRFKCSKQEVERAIVACEGDLQKAAESLRESKQDPPSLSPKPEETGDPPTGTNGKLPVAVSQNLRPQTKPNPSPTIQQRRDVKDFNYTKQGAQVGGVSLESASKTMQPLKRGQPKLEWAKPQQTPVPADRRWSNAGSNPSVSYSLASPLQVSSPPVKTETRYVAVGGELKNLQPGTVREPVIMMQRPQSVNSKQVPATSMSSSPPGSTTSWYPSTSVDMMRSSGFLPNIPSNLNSNQMYHQFQYQPQQQLVPGSNPADSPGTSRGNNLWSRAGASPTLAAASSLGLFSGLGSSGASSPAASSPAYWNAGGGGSGGQVDYTNIDWSLDRGLSSSSRPNGLWTGLPSIMKSNTNFYDPKTTGSGAQPGMRMPSSNMNSVSLVGLHDGATNVEASSAGSREWTSPFEGEDLFSLPRQFVSSSL